MRQFTIEEIRTELIKYNYIPNDNIVYAIYTAISLNRPLLIDGPAGVGKTEIARVLSKIFGGELIKIQCYEGIDSSKILADINYPKQLLYQNILRGNIDLLIKDKKFEEAVSIIEKETNFYNDSFIIKRPIYRALDSKSENTNTLLIDELDKVDQDIEAVLLEVLDTFTITLPEIGTITCPEDKRPMIVLTSNNNRELTEALRRRCIYLYISYPSMEVEREIILKKAKVSFDFANSVANLMSRLRSEIDLRQNPSIAESIQWANMLFNYMGCNEISSKFKKEIIGTLSALIKNQKDLEKTTAFIERVV